MFVFLLEKNNQQLKNSSRRCFGIVVIFIAMVIAIVILAAIVGDSDLCCRIPCNEIEKQYVWFGLGFLLEKKQPTAEEII